MASVAETTSLEDLPVEMIEAILNELPPEDVRNIRLVCKELEEKSLDYYTKFFFANRTVLLSSQYSVEDLHNISRHPRFGKSLRRVTLVLRSFQFAQMSERWSAFARTLKSGNAALTQEQKDGYLTLRRSYSSMTDCMDSYVYKSSWIAPLHDGLKNLVDRDNNPFSLRITAYPTSSWADPRQFRRLEEALGPLEMTECQLSSEHMEAILGNAFKFSCSLEELTVPQRVDLNTLRDLSSLDANLRMAPFSALQKLELTFIVGRRTTSQGFEGLEALLASLPQITTLTLQSWYAQDYGRSKLCKSAHIVSNAVLPKLHAANLNVDCLSREQVHRFVKAHISTLREFRLNGNKLFQDTLLLLKVDLEEIAADAGVSLEFMDYDSS